MLRGRGQGLREWLRRNGHEGWSRAEGTSVRSSGWRAGGLGAACAVSTGSRRTGTLWHFVGAGCARCGGEEVAEDGGGRAATFDGVGAGLGDFFEDREGGGEEAGDGVGREEVSR